MATATFYGPYPVMTMEEPSLLLELSVPEALRLLEWIDSHTQVKEPDGPVTAALREALKEAG